MLAGIFAYLGWQIYLGRETLAALDLHWNGLELAAGFLSALVAYQCLPGAWMLMLHRAGYFRKKHVGDYVRIWWVSFLYRYVPGKVLLLVERTRMGVAVEIPAAAGATLTIIETLLAIVAGSIVSFLAVAFYAELDHRLQIGVVTIIVVAILLVPIVFRRISDLRAIKEKYPSLGSVAFSHVELVTFVLPYIAHYLLIGLSFFLVSRSVHPFAWADLSGMIGIYALSHVVSLIAFIAPGGLGVREGVLAVQLARVLPDSIAGALVIGVRLWFVLVELACVLTVLLICPMSDESKSHSNGPSFNK